MNKAQRKEKIKQATLKHYRETVTQIRRVVLKAPGDQVDTLLMLRAVLQVKPTNHAHHFNGGNVYVNQKMFERSSVFEQIAILTKLALHTAAWMENRLHVRPHRKTRKAYRELNVSSIITLGSNGHWPPGWW